MQGAFKVLIAVVATAGALPATSSAQVLDVSPVQLPSVSVPPVTVPAPLPQVSIPKVSTPPVTAPGVRVDPPVPAAPSLPPVQAPVPPPPRPAAPPVDSPARTPSSPSPAASSGRAPSGTVAAAGTPSASPARGGRVARAAAVSGGRGVLGTSYRSPRLLVRALSACVPGLPERQEQLLVMRYGVGAAAAHPDRAVASALGLSRGEYTLLRRSALRGLVHDARAGGCRDAGQSSSAPAIAFGDGGEVRPVAAALGSSSSRGAEIAVRGERASGGSESLDKDGGGLTTPLALDAAEPARSRLVALMVVGAIALLALSLRALTRARG